MMLYKTDEYPVRPTKEPVPTEVQQACDKANTWLTSTSTWLIPYLAICSEGPDEWHLMLQDKSGNELCRVPFKPPSAIMYNTRRFGLVN